MYGIFHLPLSLRFANQLEAISQLVKALLLRVRISMND